MMRYYFAVFVMSLCLIASSVQAETSIGILDVQQLLRDSKAAQSIQEQVDVERQAFLKKLAERENSLRDKEQALLKEAPSLSQEELNERRAAFEKEFQEARHAAQQQKDALDKALLDGMTKLREIIFEVVDQVSAEKGYDLILARQNVVSGGDNLDISEETLSILNQRVNNIPLALSGQ